MKKIEEVELNEDIFKLIEKDWMLISSGKKDDFNMMTASWGGMGILWFKKVCFIFVRPQRYTFEYIEKNENFTLTFFGDENRDALMYCGKNSGRNVDKVKEANLHPFETENGSIAFNDGKMVVECKKLYFNDLDKKNYLDPKINEFYKDDYHRMYIGEIIGVYK